MYGWGCPEAAGASLTSAPQEVLGVAAVLTAVGWLVAAAVLYRAGCPANPPVGPQTLDLGPEPPAVANCLVNGLRVSAEAVPATVLDLAARGVLEIEERGPGAYYVRVREVGDEVLTPYELRVLLHLEGLARDGVVPALALTTGSGEQSRRWMLRFANAVVADAQRRGLSRDRLDRGRSALLGAAALIPAALIWAATDEIEVGVVAFGGALALLGWIKARNPQQVTAEGIAATSRWLGVRAALAENDVFDTRSPLEVPLWSRLLAYGAALGAAGAAARGLPLGEESHTRAWSASGGRWRMVRIAYPRMWPIGWGLSPLLAFVFGVGTAGFGGLMLFSLAPALDATGVGLLAVAAAAFPCAAIGIGVTLVATAVADLGVGTSVTGPILRLRVIGSDRRRRHYVAVDDGSSSTIRALILDPLRFSRLTQGDVVSVEVGRALGDVRSIQVVSREEVEAPDQ